MKDPVRRDSLITIILLALFASVFIVGVFVPSQKSERAIRREIADASRSIGEIPMRVAELDALVVDVAQRKQYLEVMRSQIPSDPDVHTILSRVASLARGSKLAITRLEPLKPISNETYDVLPIHLNLSGNFYGVMELLKGLETQPRVITVEDISLSKNSERGEYIEVSIQFNAYVNRENYGEFTQKVGSSDLRGRR